MVAAHYRSVRSEEHRQPNEGMFPAFTGWSLEQPAGAIMELVAVLLRGWVPRAQRDARDRRSRRHLPQPPSSSSPSARHLEDPAVLCLSLLIRSALIEEVGP
ncbi:unnamed protein product [Urochloa humidicola]